MVIRPFLQSDLAEVTAMWSALNRHIYAQTLNPLFQEDDAAFPEEAGRRFKLIMENSEHCGLIATNEAAILGLAVAHIRNYPWMAVKHVGCIAAVWVAPKHRRRGVGRALVMHVDGWFAARSVKHATLTWMNKNREAECFWRSLGYVGHSLTAGKVIG